MISDALLDDHLAEIEKKAGDGRRKWPMSPMSLLELVAKVRSLQEDSGRLRMLEEFGVENWPGYGDAMVAYKEEMNDQLQE